MRELFWISTGFLGGIAVMGFIAERRYRKLERDIQAHINVEDKIRRYGV